MEKFRKHLRCSSESASENYSYAQDEKNEKETPLPSTERDEHSKINFVHYISAKAEEKADRSEAQIRRTSIMLEQPAFTHIVTLGEDQSNSKNDDIIISSTVSPSAIIDMGANLHRDIKPGSQRCRWNLLFNFLIWLIVPFPLWIPFISNTTAYYVLPSIQGVFVLIWISKCK